MSAAGPTRGHAVTRDGRRLHYERHGAGAPVVVCEAGMGVSRNSWGGVILRIATHTSVVAYDRSGLGQSPPDPARRDLTRLTDDLLDLLDHFDGDRFVLVGHSWGGPIVRSAASRSPSRIRGLVLVDQTDESCDLFFSTAMKVQERLSGPVMSVAAHTGLLRRFVSKQSMQIPEPWSTAMRAEDGTPAALREQLSELRNCTSDLHHLRDHPLKLPDVPVTVISGGQTGFLERRRRGSLIAAHRALAEATPRGRHVVAEDSTHYVPLTQPDLIAAEVLRIVDHER